MSRLRRLSPSTLDPDAPCGDAACPGRLRVQDWHTRGWLRYEVWCPVCLRCDPNGYATQAEVVAAVRHAEGD
jgi:hypothetical protein